LFNESEYTVNKLRSSLQPENVINDGLLKETGWRLMTDLHSLLNFTVACSYVVCTAFKFHRVTLRWCNCIL